MILVKIETIVGFFFEFRRMPICIYRDITAVQLVYNHFRQFVSQLELYSQLHLSLKSDPIACGLWLVACGDPI